MCLPRLTHMCLGYHAAEHACTVHLHKCCLHLYCRPDALRRSQVLANLSVGDHAASRAPFQILIALTATPRFIFLGLQWLAHRYPPQVSLGYAPARPLSTPLSTSGSTGLDSKRTLRSRSRQNEKGSDDELDSDIALDPPTNGNGRKRAWGTGSVDVEVMLGLARTIACGGWMFITSRDQHDLHDLFMIVYMVLDVPWFYLSWAHSTTPQAKKWRAICASGFLACIPPLIYLFVQHNIKKVPGGEF